MPSLFVLKYHSHVLMAMSLGCLRQDTADKFKPFKRFKSFKSLKAQ
jgi:hypothetical protein